MKKISFILIIFIYLILSINIIKADSGWDVNYDIGGSSSYSDGYGSYSNDSSYDYSSSSSSQNKYKTKIKKTINNDMITLNDNGTYIYILKYLDTDLYSSLYNDGNNSDLTKSVYNDRIILKEKNNEIVIYRSKYPDIYEQLRGKINPESRSIFVYDDRVEVGENGITTIVYKSENEELYNQLKKEARDKEKNSIIILSIGSFIFFLITFSFYLFVFKKTKSNNKIKKEDIIEKYEIKSLEKQILEKHNLNEEKIVNNLYDSYVKVQEAWSKFDYETLKQELSNELYNTYVNELEVLKSKEQTNIMYGFQFVSGYVKGIEEKNNIITTMDIYLKVRLHDFVVDKNMNVVRGNKENLIEIGYIISIVYEKSDINNCPNCGAKLDFTNEGECSYCKTKIIKPAGKFVICQKKAVDQKRS